MNYSVTKNGYLDDLNSFEITNVEKVNIYQNYGLSLFNAILWEEMVSWAFT